MKHLSGLLLAAITACALPLHAQVGIGTATPNASALLDLTSTARGFLPPRMTTAQRDAIGTPATGLVVYNTSTNALNVYNGTNWVVVGSGGGGGWELTGNALATGDFLGSTNAQPLPVRTNNVERLRVLANGQVGIGTTAPNAAAILEIASTTLGFLPPRMTTAQRDAIATPPDGLIVYLTDADALSIRIGGVWAAVSTSGGSGWGLTGNAGTAPATNYLGTSDNVDFVLRTNALERLRVTAAGNVGIGINSATDRLVVAANASGANGGIRVANTATTANSASSVEISKVAATATDVTMRLRAVDAGATSFAEIGTASSSELRLVTDGANRMILTPGGSVGINVGTPGERLDVDGNIQGNAFRFRTPVTHYLAIPPTAFTPNSPNFRVAFRDFWNNFTPTPQVNPNVVYGEGGTAGQAGFVVAPVNLPQGAVLTGGAITYVRNGGTIGDILCRIVRLTPNYTTDGAETVAEYSGFQTSGGSIRFDNMTVNTSRATIDNLNYFYYVVFRVDQGNPSPALYGVRLRYDVAVAD